MQYMTCRRRYCVSYKSHSGMSLHTWIAWISDEHASSNANHLASALIRRHSTDVLAPHSYKQYQ